MKIKIEKKYVQIGLTIFLTALAILLVFFLIWRYDSFSANLKKFNKAMSPLYYGLIIAYLLSPILNFLEKKCLIPVFDKFGWYKEDKDPKRKKHIRVWGVVFTLIVVFLFFYLFFSNVIPEIVLSIQSIVGNYNVYTKNLVDWVNKILENNPDLNSVITNVLYDYSDETNNWLNDMVLPALTRLLPNIGDFFISFSSSIINFIKVLCNIFIGLIISIYVLGSKEKFTSNGKKLCYSVLETKSANKFIEAVRFVHQTFIGFFSGKVVDSLIIGMICFICLTIMNMPYTILISIIIGITNIIPFFGPLFGAIPSALLILMVDPKKALIFIIFIIILQQFDGNYLGPKILSQTTGITTFWIIVSITFFSSMMGVLGMIIAVPFTAVLLALVNLISSHLLAKKELTDDIEQYEELEFINENKEFIHTDDLPKVIEKPKEKGILTRFIIWLWKKITGLFKKKNDK